MRHRDDTATLSTTHDPRHELDAWRFLAIADARLESEPDHDLWEIWQDEFLMRCAARPYVAERDALVVAGHRTWSYGLAEALARVDALRRERAIRHGG